MTKSAWLIVIVGFSRPHSISAFSSSSRAVLLPPGSFTSPPTGPESVQHNPQQPVAAVEAQATRRVLLENRKLVAKREYHCLQGSTGSKTGAIKAKRATKKELIVIATMIPRMVGTLVFSDRTEFSVATPQGAERQLTKAL
jgi:hypothetical protein